MKILKLLFLLSAVFVFSSFDGCKKDEPNTLSVTPSSLTFDARDTSQKLLVITTNAIAWEYQLTESWVTAEKNESVLNISVENYTNPTSSRSAVIMITAGNAPAVPVIITQNAKDQDGLSVNPTALNFTYNATASQSVAVTTNAPSWDVTAGATWITATKNDNNVNVTVSQNTSTSERNGNVTVKGGDAADVSFSVTQAAAPPFLTVSTSTYDFSSANAGSTTVSVSSNISWTASSNASSWLTVTPTSGSNNGTLTLTVTANTSTTTDRSGVITVTGSGITRTVTVTQPKQTPPPPPTETQVRFRKLTHSSSYPVTEMAIVTITSSTTMRLEASYTFNSSTGTSSYQSIAAGTYSLAFREGSTWYRITNSGQYVSHTFQAGRRYTFEISDNSATSVSYYVYNDGTFSISNQGLASPQQPTEPVQIILKKENLVKMELEQ